LDNIVS